MKVAYVAGPYRADTIYGVAQNIQKARDVALRLWKLGYAVICPHSNTAFFDGVCPDSVWLDGYIEILKRCDLVVLVDGWENSAGARREVEVAVAHGIPIYVYGNDDRLRLYDMKRHLGYRGDSSVGHPPHDRREWSS